MAANTLNSTTFAAVLKVLYPKGLEYLMYDEAPIIKWLPKRTDFTGTSLQVNPIVQGVQGSADFTTALAASGQGTHQKFNVTRVKDYVVATIDNETLMASKDKKGAVAEAMDTQIRQAMYAFTRSTATKIWSLGNGSLGQVGSISTTDLTLKQINDVTNFEVGMEVESSENDGTTGALQSGTATITAINRDTGILTTDSNWTAQIATLDADDYLFREGDFGNSPAGLFRWIPPSNSPAALFGVTRTTDKVRLAGSYITGGGKDLESIIFDACAQARVNSGRPDTLWVNSKRFAELQKSMHSKATYEMMAGGKDKAKFGFNGFVVPGELGPVTVYADPSCPYAYGLLTRRDSWSLASLGGLPHYSKEDGLKLLRETNSDGVSFRLKAYYNLVCKRPVDSVCIDWDN